MLKRSTSKGPLTRKIARALEHGSASITSQEVIEYIRAFKSQYPNSNAGLDYMQLLDADVFEDDEIVLAPLWGPYALWKNDLPQSRATA